MPFEIKDPVAVISYRIDILKQRIELSNKELDYTDPKDRGVIRKELYHSREELSFLEGLRNLLIRNGDV